MASKTPDGADPGKTWKPGDPLRLDKAIQKNPANEHLADRLNRAGDALPSPVRHPNRPVTPTNHKPFNRQKKG
jgi:hypothetical protein